jgi:hypothetical protein
MIFSEEMLGQLQILVEGGLSATEIEESTGIPRKEIQALKRTHRWKVDPAAVASRELDVMDVESADREKIIADVDAGGAIAAAGEGHATRLFAKVSAHLLSMKKLPAIKTWKDVQIADTIARRAARMDTGDGGGGNKTVINLGIVAGGRMLPIATPVPTPLKPITLTTTDNQNNDHEHEPLHTPTLPRRGGLTDLPSESEVPDVDRRD